ncbi:MAG: hypothetical protein QM501_08795 [Gimesia sp.]
MLFGLLLALTVIYFVEGHRDVNTLLMRDEWLMAVDGWLNDGSNAPKRGRNASIRYGTLGTCEEYSGEDFQNTGTFIVVKDSVFTVSSVHNTHLARDAYNAY